MRDWRATGRSARHSDEGARGSRERISRELVSRMRDVSAWITANVRPRVRDALDDGRLALATRLLATSTAAKDVTGYVRTRMGHPTPPREHFARALDALVADTANELIEAKKSVAVCIANHKRLCNAAEQEQRNAAEWERRALLAHAAGDPMLVEQARTRAREHEHLARERAEDATKLGRQIDTLKHELRAMNALVEEAKRTRNGLAANLAAREAAVCIDRGLRTAREVVTLLEGISALESSPPDRTTH